MHMCVTWEEDDEPGTSLFAGCRVSNSKAVLTHRTSQFPPNAVSQVCRGPVCKDNQVAAECVTSGLPRGKDWEQIPGGPQMLCDSPGAQNAKALPPLSLGAGAGVAALDQQGPGNSQGSPGGCFSGSALLTLPCTLSPSPSWDTQQARATSPDSACPQRESVVGPGPPGSNLGPAGLQGLPGFVRPSKDHLKQNSEKVRIFSPLLQYSQLLTFWRLTSSGDFLSSVLFSRVNHLNSKNMHFYLKFQ